MPVPNELRGDVPPDATQHVDRKTENDVDVTVSDNGNSGQSYEDILDVQPNTDVAYELRGNKQLRITRLSLDATGGTDITDNANLAWFIVGPTEIDDRQVSREYTYGEFANKNLRNENEYMHFEFRVPENKAYITEGAHLKLKMKHDTAVDWAEAGTAIEFEIVEWSGSGR